MYVCLARLVLLPHYWWRYTTWGRPYLAAPVIAAGGVAAYATTPTTNRCTCV